MPICPACGLDVETEGLCNECRSEAINRETNRKKGSRLSNLVIIILLVFTGFLSGLTGVLTGRLLPVAGDLQAVYYQAEIPRMDLNSDIDILDDALHFDLALREKHPPLENKEEYVAWMLENTNEDEFFISWRWDCVQDLIRWKSINLNRIKEAFLLVPREYFIRKKNQDRAYEHAYMPIGYGATITDPWVVSTMTEAINPGLDQKVLEIGTGSGYQSALLSQLSNYVYTVEIIDVLARETDALYNSLVDKYPEYENIRRKSGDGYFGWGDNARFDRIIVTCAIDHIPPALLKQLKPEGIMVIPVGPPSGQRLLKIIKHVSRQGDIYFDREDIFVKGVHFIPFTKKGGGTYSE